jgi:C4-dicarboxylate-binding protein DctP
LSDQSFDIDFKHSGVLGGQIETIDQVLAGTIQATTPALPALAGYYPNIQVFSIPYLWENPAVAWEVLDGDFGRRFFDAMGRESGLRPIAVFDNGGYRSFTNSNRPIRRPEDMQGIKIRTIESPTQMKIVESLGAAPTPIAWMELYSSLQTGVVDGQENSPATIISGSLHEVQKYYTLDQHTLSLAGIVVSEEWFQNLSPERRTQVSIAGRVAAVAGRGAAWANNKLAMDFLAEEGMEIYVPKRAERDRFKGIAQPVVLAWMRENSTIENVWIDELLDAVRVAEEKLGLTRKIHHRGTEDTAP